MSEWSQVLRKAVISVEKTTEKRQKNENKKGGKEDRKKGKGRQRKAMESSISCEDVKEKKKEKKRKGWK